MQCTWKFWVSAQTGRQWRNWIHHHLCLSSWISHFSEFKYLFSNFEALLWPPCFSLENLAEWMPEQHCREMLVTQLWIICGAGKHAFSKLTLCPCKTSVVQFVNKGVDLTYFKNALERDELAFIGNSFAETLEESESKGIKLVLLQPSQNSQDGNRWWNCLMLLLQEWNICIKTTSLSGKLNQSRAGMETISNGQVANVILILPLDKRVPHTQENCPLSRLGQWIQSACSAPLTVGPNLAFSVF